MMKMMIDQHVLSVCAYIGSYCQQKQQSLQLCRAAWGCVCRAAGHASIAPVSLHKTVALRVCGAVVLVDT
jgi:hypothetical protein